MADEKAIVLFSGGQDSTVCLAWALNRYQAVETVGFDFGQRHRIELTQRLKILDALKNQFPNWSNRIGDDHLVTLSELPKIGETALTHDVAIEMTESGLPSTFVPGRNLLFFTYAAALGYRRNITTLVGGMCETDFSGYPDCRDETLKSLQKTISLGMGKDFSLQTPLMFLDKAATWKMTERLGGAQLVELVIEHSHSCYLGQRNTRHAWGYGCGTCPACTLRRRGYTQWQSEHSTSA